LNFLYINQFQLDNNRLNFEPSEVPMNIISNPSTSTAGCVVCQPSLIIKGLKDALTVVSETAKKVAFIASIYFMKAAMVTLAALNGAWNATKTLGHNTAALAKTVGIALLEWAHIAGNKSAELAQSVKKGVIVASIYLGKAAMIGKEALQAALHASWVATKNFGGKTMEATKFVAHVAMDLLKKLGHQTLQVTQKAAHFTAKYFSIAAHFAAQRLSDAKAGIGQGLQISKHFLATHQKETALLGCGIVIGTGAYYVASRMFAGPKEVKA
jgi:hypothetical protein